MNKYIVVKTESLKPLDHVGKGNDDLKSALAIYLENPVDRTMLKVIDFMKIKVDET